MIYFITENHEYYSKAIDSKIFPDIKVLEPQFGLALYYHKLGKKKILALDTETNGLDPYMNDILLTGIGDKNNQFMFDWTINLVDLFNHFIKYDKIALGHNLKFDIKMLKVETGIQLVKVYDTMLADQRLWMKSGYTWGLADLILRYCNKSIIKSTRNEFIGANKNTFKINASHLYYLKGDLIDLFEIRKKQQTKIRRFKMEFLIYGIEFPLITVIAEAELEGFVLDVPKWLERINKEKERKFELECLLDEEVRRLRDLRGKEIEEQNLDPIHRVVSPKTLLAGGKYDNPRKHNPLYDIFNTDGTTTEQDLFGNKAKTNAYIGSKAKAKKKINASPNNINYLSKEDVVKIFGALGETAITTLETFKVPQLNQNGKVIELNQYSLEESSLQKFILAKPNSIMIPFLEMKMEHSKLCTALNTFGENYIDKVNPITNKLHTAIRQCFADTGRMQSGGGKKEPDKINSQNIPAKNEYRNCFTVEKNNSIISADYSGAELIVMCSHAQDSRLLELSEQDMHSYMATKCWRNIYEYRARKLLSAFNLDIRNKTDILIEQYNKYRDLLKNYTVTKELKNIRTAFKPMTFGIIYGMYAKKAGATLNITKEEGQIVINTIKQEIPLTIAMVEKASADAERLGYVILNERTNSRMWFPTLIKQLKGETNRQLEFLKISSEASEARNGRIQGTQADFVKEASVVLWKYFQKCKKYNDFYCIILTWVHDELVIKIPKNLDGKSEEYINNSNKLIPSSLLTKGKLDTTLPETIKLIMENVANRYLVNVTIQVEAEVEPYWKK